MNKKNIYISTSRVTIKRYTEQKKSEYKKKSKVETMQWRKKNNIRRQTKHIVKQWQKQKTMCS